MAKLTKVLFFIVLLSLVMTAYAFASFLGVNTKPLPEPVNLLITGTGLFMTGHFIRHITKK